MTNGKMLEKAIMAKGYKMNYLASALDISYKAFYNKLYGKTEFKASEIVRLSKILSLTDEQRDNIFLSGGVM